MEDFVKSKGSGKPLTGFRQGSDVRFALWRDHFGCSELERNRCGSRRMI